MSDIVVPQKFRCANACTCEKTVKGNQTLRSQTEVTN